MPESNKQVVVVYKSKYGSTKQYAEWIADEVSADLFTTSEVKITDLLPYKTIVFGGGLYAVGINGIDLLKKNFRQLQTKKLIVFAVGASPARQEVIADVLASNFDEQVQDKINFFLLRGAFNYEQLNFRDKLKMWLLKLKLKSKPSTELTADEQGLLASYNQPVDWTDKTTISPIINCIMN